jgi:hypothetical protein
MGESRQERLRLEPHAPVRVEFVGSKISSDAGLVAHRDLHETLGSTALASE